MPVVAGSVDESDAALVGGACLGTFNGVGVCRACVEFVVDFGLREDCNIDVGVCDGSGCRNEIGVAAVAYVVGCDA